MSFSAMFKTWDQVEAYVQESLGTTYLENPTSWVEAMKQLTTDRGLKYVKVINDTTGEISSQFYPEDMVSGVGEIHIVSDTATSSASTVSSAKSIPVGKSVVTQETASGGTAVLTEEAVGVKNTGAVTMPNAINVIGGALQTYGLIMTAVNIGNSKVWKDLCNSVFDTEFTDATPLDVLRNFLKTKVSIFTALSDDELVTQIPDSIAEKLYNWLKVHMEQGEPVAYPDMGPMSMVFRKFKRDITPSNPNLVNFDRYISISNPTASARMPIAKLSDTLIKEICADFVSVLIGAGYSVGSNVGTALVESVNGLYATMVTRQGAIANCNRHMFAMHLTRSGSVPISTPIALSELSFSITSFNDTGINVSDDNVAYDVNLYNNALTSYVDSGVELVAGDCVVYKKRNKEGSADTDFAYLINLNNGSSIISSYITNVTYPSNEIQINVSSSSMTKPTYDYVNGYVTLDILEHYYDMPHDVYYSNIGWVSDEINYEPDDYLVTAGFRKNGNEKNPDPTQTKEERYPTLATKTQSANPQTVLVSGTPVVQNAIKDYVNISVPMGSDNADRILDHGINNINDPDTYVDNRSQSDKLNGRVNKNDPVDGFNTDVQSSIDAYNQSRNNPDHYPEPIPENQINPQYPDNLPTDPSGDSGDTPTPSSMTGVTASGMCSVYNPSKEQLKNFSAWLWSPNFLDNFLKIFQNPMDAIIGLHIMYATPITGTPANIVCGYLDSGVSAKVVTQQFSEINCGHVAIPEYFGNALDYEPYTQVHIYLPFIGMVSIKPNDVIGKELYIKYGVDAMTGTCLATLTTKKGSSEITCYTFPGNCACQIPISGGNYAQVISGLASMAVGVTAGAVSANPLAVAGGVMAGVMSSHLDVAHGGTIGANAGAMGIRTPYVIITRKSAYEASRYNEFYGYPANKTVQLSSCKGYTRVKHVHIEIPIATVNEKKEIETLLKQGVIIL